MRPTDVAIDAEIEKSKAFCRQGCYSAALHAISNMMAKWHFITKEDRQKDEKYQELMWLHQSYSRMIPGNSGTI